MESCPFLDKWDPGVWNQGIFRILFCFLLISYVGIIPEATILRVFPYTDVGVFFLKVYLSRSHKLADADPVGTLDSWYVWKNV